MSDDEDFWDIDGADGPRPARRRTGASRRRRLVWWLKRWPYKAESVH